MNYFEYLQRIEAFKFWCNTITLGLFRIALTFAAIKYCFWG